MEANFISYINNLYENQNINMDYQRTNLLSKKDYYLLFKSTCELLQDFKDASLDEQRAILFEKSGVEEKLQDFIYKKQFTSGIVASYGTELYNETILMGNRQEVDMNLQGNLKNSKEAMNEDTIFDIASVTKLYTSLSILKLVEDGAIKLSDKITDHAPQFKNLKELSIFDLLSFAVPLKTSQRLDELESVDEAEQTLFDIEINHEASKARPYTDMGAMVLKYVIEGAAACNYSDFVKRNIIDPLKLDNTFTVVPDSKIENVANTNFGVSCDREGNFKINFDSPLGTVHDPKARVFGQKQGNLSGHAGLFSSAKDMAVLARSLIEGKLITDQSLEEMAINRTGQKTAEDKYIPYLGYLVYSKHPQLLNSEVQHSLSGRAFSSAGYTGTQITVDPINKVYLSFGSNKTHNRLSFIAAEQSKLITKDADGRGRVFLPSGREIVDSRDFVWHKDEFFVRPLTELALQYKMLEDLQNLGKENTKTTAKTLVLH